MVAPEARICTTPAIASEVGGLDHPVRDRETGFTIPDGESDALCTKISWLLKDRKRHETMSQRAVDYAQDYAGEKLA